MYIPSTSGNAHGEARYESKVRLVFNRPYRQTSRFQGRHRHANRYEPRRTRA